MFRLQSQYDPEAFFVRRWCYLEICTGTIYREMTARTAWMNLVPSPPPGTKLFVVVPCKNAIVPGMRFDTKLPGMMSMRLSCSASGTGDALEDDRFDSTSILVRGFGTLSELQDEDFMDEEELDLIYGGPQKQLGRSTVTGY